METKKETVKPSTYREYERAIKPLKDSKLAKTKCRELNMNLIRAFLKSYDGCQNYLNNLVSLMSQCLTEIYKDDLTPCNFSEKIRKPKRERRGDKRKGRYLTPEEVETLLDKSGKMKNLLILLNETGMRIGEALALNWSDVDLEKHILYVSKTLTQRREIQRAKTDNSIRVIPLSNEACEALRSEYEKSGYQEVVFLNKRGERLQYDSVRDVMLKLKEQTGIDVTCHDFRHTCITNLYNKGLSDVEIIKMVGHHTFDFTERVYTHTNGQMVNSILQKLN